MKKLNELRIEQVLARAAAGLAFLTLALFLTAGCELDLGESGGDDKSEDQTTDTAETTDTADTDTTAEEEEEADAPAVDANGCTTLSTSDGGSGFVSNPESSRGTLKLIFPNRYEATIGTVSAYTADGLFSDVFNRVMPNEYDDRPRYYGTKAIASYPDNLIVVAEISDGSCLTFTLPNPQQRYD